MQASTRPSLLVLYIVQLIVVLIWMQLSVHFYSFIYQQIASWEKDPFVYFVVGKGMVDGVLPYRDLFDHKGPLTYLVYGMGAFLFPHSFLGVGLVVALLQAILYLYAYRIFKLYFSFHTSILLSWCLPIFIANMDSPAAIGLPCYAVSFFYFLRYWKNPQSRPHWSVLGVCVSCLLLLKFNLTAFWIPILALMLWHQLKTKGWQACFSALWLVSAGVMLPILLFVAYFALHDGGLANFWESYVLFCINYASQDIPFWQQEPYGVWAGFFAPVAAIPVTFFWGECFRPVFGIAFVLSGLFALVWPPFRHMLFPKNWAIGGTLTLWLSFVLLFLASFSGAFVFYHYYVVFLPFYLLTFLAVVYLLHAVFLEKRVLFVLGGFAFVTLLFSALWAYVSRTRDSVESELEHFVKAHRDAPLILYPQSYSQRNLYLLSNKSPAVRKFYIAPVPNYGGDESVAQALANRQCEYFMYFIRPGMPDLVQSIETELQEGYQLIRTLGETKPEGTQRVLIYQRKD